MSKYRTNQLAIERLWQLQQNIGGYPREVIAKVLAMNELGYSYREIAREFNNKPSQKTIAEWVKQAQLLEIKLPDNVLVEAQQLIANAARQKVNQIQNRFGSWASVLVDDMFAVGEFSARRLRNELDPENEKPNLPLVKQLTGTLHYIIQDVSLLAGKPTERQATSIEVEEHDSELPNLSKDELAKRLRTLADNLEDEPEEGVA